MTQTVDDCKLFELKDLGDERGGMVSIEGGKSIPFDIKRVFYTFGTDKKAVRGCHANRYSDFFIVNVKGSAKVAVFDGLSRKEFELSRPDFGLFIPRMIWKEMYDFSEDCVMMVLADTHYDATEYIKDLEKYKGIVTNPNA